MDKTVLLALSGGVDSSVAALLLKERGYSVSAVVFEFSKAHTETTAAALCAAASLDIPIHVVRCYDEFYKQVVTPFAESYLNGETPNPCIICNPLMKFKKLMETAQSLGINSIATGHYARVARVGDRFVLKKAEFLPRDQSYMLYRLTQEQLRCLLLPLSALSKEQVREIARSNALPCAESPDSQEICFIKDEHYSAFLERNFGQARRGNFISPEGIPILEHQGIIHYTVGQRKGLGVSLGKPVFISNIDPVSGDIFLSFGGGEAKGRITLSGCVYLPFEELFAPMTVTAKIRSQAKGVSATLSPLGGNKAALEFSSPQRAPARGQSCVLYQEDTVIGGGFID